MLLRIDTSSITLCFQFLRLCIYTKLPCNAASMSGNKLEAMEELDASLTEGRGVIATRLSQMKCWLLSHSQHLNFFTILVLASVSSDFLLLSYCTGLLELIDTVSVYVFCHTLSDRNCLLVPLYPPYGSICLIIHFCSSLEVGIPGIIKRDLYTDH